MSARGPTGASSRRGWLPFNVAILTVVVGLLLITCAFLIVRLLENPQHHGGAGQHVSGSGGDGEPEAAEVGDAGAAAARLTPS